MELASRRESLGFAERCKKNLLYIEQAKQSGQDVHVIAQIITSSLGLIVFPWEQKADIRIRGTLLSDLDETRWPKWIETKPSKGLGQLIHNLRNSIAHGNIHFSSDDREDTNVVVTFKSENEDWQATITAHELGNFCLRFIEFIEATID
jgi:hypothetical protein